MACDFHLRSRTETLPAASLAGGAGRQVEILHAQPRGGNSSAWRIIDLWSNEGKPWEATIRWSGGRAGQRVVYVTVSRATRICVFANTVEILGAALSLSAIHAWASISDGEIPCENQWTVRGESTDQTLNATVAVPPFAKFVRLELADESKLATSFLALIDGFGVTRAQHRASQQPNPGAPIGDAETVALTFPSGSLAWRVTFLLNV